MVTDATIGKGTTIEFLDFGFIAQGTDLSFDAMGDVEDIDVTNFDSPEPATANEWGGMEYEPGGIGDPGTISVTVIFSQDQQLPEIGHKDTVRITLPLRRGYKSPTVWSGTGYLSRRSARAETRSAYTQNIVIRASGVWSKTPAVKVS